MNAPRNDKDHFLYPYVMKAIEIVHNIRIEILPSLQEKGKEANNKQCMNTLSP